MSSPISADEIFHNGQIRLIYPVFNRELFLEYGVQPESDNDRKGVWNCEKAPTIRLPLRKLFIEERKKAMIMITTSSSSSSEVGDLDRVPEDSNYVWQVWLPKEAAADGQCKKSSSTCSNSKRWKFKDFLHKSHSDGIEDNFVYLSLCNSGRKNRTWK